jgi:hypothetical protein
MTGQPVSGQSDAAIQQLSAYRQQQTQGAAGMGESLLAGSIASLAHSMQQRHDPVAAELRIERLERELAQLQARVAKLERKP